MKNGIVRKVIGPVVDVQFPNGHLPEIYNAIEVTVEGRKIVMEAVQHLGQDSVRCISLFSTDGMSRGCQATDTGHPVTMPVGEATLGRMFNVVGEPIDGKGCLLYTSPAEPTQKEKLTPDKKVLDTEQTMCYYNQAPSETPGFRNRGVEQSGSSSGS